MESVWLWCVACLLMQKYLPRCKKVERYWLYPNETEVGENVELK